MDFWTATQTALRNYATFSGRARRSEFWYFWLALILGGILASILDAALATETLVGGGLVSTVFSLGTLLPGLAVTTRRLHDRNRSGWWQAAPWAALILLAVMARADGVTEGENPVVVALLIACALASVVLFILLFVWLVRAGDRGPNRFGADPVPPPVAVEPLGSPGTA
jgi:uncharacterized membrane protein YhaH (DUF805 family)